MLAQTGFGATVLIIVLLAAVTGILLLISERTRYCGKAVISDAIGAGALFAVIEVFVSNIGIGTPLWVLLTEFAAVVLTAAVIICAIWGRLKSKAVWIPLAAALLLCCAVAVAWHLLCGQSFPAPSEPGLH